MAAVNVDTATGERAVAASPGDTFTFRTAASQVEVQNLTDDVIDVDVNGDKKAVIPAGGSKIIVGAFQDPAVYDHGDTMDVYGDGTGNISVEVVQ